MILEAGAFGPADVYPAVLRASGNLYFCVPFLTYLREGHLWYLVDSEAFLGVWDCDLRDFLRVSCFFAK